MKCFILTSILISIVNSCKFKIISGTHNPPNPINNHYVYTIFQEGDKDYPVCTTGMSYAHLCDRRRVAAFFDNHPNMQKFTLKYNGEFHDNVEPTSRIKAEDGLSEEVIFDVQTDCSNIAYFARVDV